MVVFSILKRVVEVYVFEFLKENMIFIFVNDDEKNDVVFMEVYVKWEVIKENLGKFINKFKVVKDVILVDLRKFIEIYFGLDK